MKLRQGKKQCEAQVGMILALVILGGGMGEAAGVKAAPESSTSADGALSYLQGRWTAVHGQVRLLRGQLVEAVTWGHHLQQRLADYKHGAEVEQRDMRGFLARQANKSAAELATERARVQLVGQRLEAAVQAIRARDESLELMHQELVESNKDKAQERKDSEEKTQRLESELAGQRKQVSVVEDTIRQLQKEKDAEDEELTAAKLQARKAQDEEATIKQAQAREQQLKAMVIHEHNSGVAHESALQAELLAQAHRLEEEQRREQELKHQLVHLSQVSRSALANSTFYLNQAMRRQKLLYTEEEGLATALKSNETENARLQAEVAKLKRTAAEEGRARAEAEETARQAQQALVSAQAVAKQLSGAVPQLLEQAKLAHEARDAEKAMRAQTQAAARQQIEKLEQQYTAAVTEQISVLPPTQPPPPGPSVNETSLPELMLDGELASDAVEDAATQEAPMAGEAGQDEAPAPDAAAHRQAAKVNLAEDATGLGQFLQQGGPGSANDM